MKKVSILVPVYGVEKFIKKCACSLFEQTYGNLEYIFVNDCTKDNSIEILKDVLENYPDRKKQTRIIAHEVNRGIAAVRNTLIDHATGEYFLFVDSDDFLELNAVELLLNESLIQSADIVVGRMNIVKKNKVSVPIVSVPQAKTDYIRFLLEQRIIPSTVGRLYTKKLWKESGIRFLEGANYGEDYAVIPRLVYYANRVVHLDASIYNYVDNADSYTHNITWCQADAVVKGVGVLIDFFSQLDEYELYKHTLITAKLRAKLSLLKMGNVDIYSYVASFYPELYPAYKSCLSRRDRILLNLVEHKYYRIAHLYARCGLWMKRKMVNR